MTDIERRRFRDACGLFGTGVTVVTTHVEDEDHGMTVNAFMSISLDPPMVAVSIAQKARMLPILRRSRRFAVSVLAEGMDAIAAHFAARGRARLDDIFERRDGLPVVKGAVASFVCDLEQAFEAGDHTIFVGRVGEFAGDGERRPLLFFHGRYGGLAGERAGPATLIDNVLDQVW